MVQVWEFIYELIYILLSDAKLAAPAQSMAGRSITDDEYFAWKMEYDLSGELIEK